MTGRISSCAVPSQAALPAGLSMTVRPPPLSTWMRCPAMVLIATA
jgi:hypothetical protein